MLGDNAFIDPTAQRCSGANVLRQFTVIAHSRPTDGVSGIGRINSAPYAPCAPLETKSRPTQRTHAWASSASSTMTSWYDTESFPFILKSRMLFKSWKDARALYPTRGSLNNLSALCAYPSIASFNTYPTAHQPPSPMGNERSAMHILSITLISRLSSVIKSSAVRIDGLNIIDALLRAQKYAKKKKRKRGSEKGQQTRNTNGAAKRPQSSTPGTLTTSNKVPAIVVITYAPLVTPRSSRSPSLPHPA